VFSAAFFAALPPEAVLSVLQHALARRGVALEGGRPRLSFPAALLVDQPVVRVGTAAAFVLDRARIAWEPSGLPAWLPSVAALAKGPSLVEVRASPAFWNPSRILVRAENVRSEDLAPLLPAPAGLVFSLRSARIVWSRRAGGEGAGAALFENLRIPVPVADSPVREALLDNVVMRLAVRGENLHVTSLEGRFEGSAVEGTGAITGFLAPARASVTFHLMIKNPVQGRAATLLRMVEKNARNANLRIAGPLLAPAGEFELF